MGSMITREAAGTILTHAGPEIGVASTKAFTAQITALLLLASYLGQVRKKVSADCARALAGAAQDGDRRVAHARGNRTRDRHRVAGTRGGG
jgi:glucosamine--fructose-6-phosphate aminotransferase (isomerizing)